MENNDDKLSTLSKGADLGRRLYCLYALPPLILTMIAATKGISVTVLVIALISSYVLITIFLVSYFRYHGKLELKEKQEMQKSEDKFYSNYFRNKKNY